MTTPDGVPGAPDLPEAAGRRLGGATWASGLSVPDFAATLALGAQPVGVVQGYAVMQWGYGAMSLTSPWGWNPSSLGGGYYEQWQCPHGFVGAEHRMVGYNFEQPWQQRNWEDGWNLAYGRMLEEATALGAHGIVGVSDSWEPLVSGGTMEFRLSGTAVVVDGAEPPPIPFATYLAGQRLAKLVENGFVPVAVVGALGAVQMFGYCITQFQLRGGIAGNWSGSMVGGIAGVHGIQQVDRANAAARRLARERLRRRLGSDELHGALVWQSERELGEGDLEVQCLLRGTRVRRFDVPQATSAADPVVRLV